MVMERWYPCMMGALPLTAMVAVECAAVSISTLSKAAMTQGLSSFVFVVYYKGLSTIILLPFFLCRRKQASLTISMLCRFFLLGLSGSVIQMLFYAGVKYSSPTLSSAMGNLVPVFTYLLAIIFRMEEPNLRSPSGQAKILGALVSILGALTVTFYKGQQILELAPPPPSSGLFLQLLAQSQHSTWVLGGLLLAIGALQVAVGNIFQTSVVKEFPEKITIVFFLSFFTTILCGCFTLIVERNPNAWKLKPAGIELIAITYSAIFGGVLKTGVLAWVLHEKGPFYVAMFRPMGIAIAVVLGVLFLREPLYFGSMIGAAIITLGFYAVMWGKAKEQSQSVVVPEDKVGCTESSSSSSSSSSSDKTPLLQNKPKPELDI